MLSKNSSDVNWAVELVGELINEVTKLMIRQTTHSPEDLFDNANREQAFLLFYEGLMREVNSSDSSEGDILETISSLLVIVGIEVQSALRDSISCNFCGEANNGFPIFI